MRPGLRVEVKKDKEKGTYSVETNFGRDVFVCSRITDKEDAIRCRDDAKLLLDKIKLRKLKACLTDVMINDLAYEHYPKSDKGIFENMLLDLLCRNFVKTAKFIRDKLFELNLEEDNSEDKIE